VKLILTASFTETTPPTVTGLMPCSVCLACGRQAVACHPHRHGCRNRVGHAVQRQVARDDRLQCRTILILDRHGPACEGDCRVAAHVQDLWTCHRFLDLRHIVRRLALAGDFQPRGVDGDADARAGRIVEIGRDRSGNFWRQHFVLVAGEAEHTGFADVDRRAASRGVDGVGARAGAAGHRRDGDAA
jgi:hypothetical protein